MEMKHVMVDLETLGVSADSVFLSLAAVQFDPHSGKLGNEFAMNIELNSALKAGRIVQGGTIQWWLTQKPEITKKMFDSPSPLVNVLEAFRRFIALNGLVYPWGNSAGFDLGMVADAYTRLGLSIPWQPWHERCYRTAFALSELQHAPKPTEAHDPIIDCKYQIKELQRCWEKLGIQK